MTQKKAPRLTAREIDAILMISGDSDAVATIESCCGDQSEAEQRRILDDYNRGRGKLQAMLDSREEAQERRKKKPKS